MGVSLLSPGEGGAGRGGDPSRQPPFSFSIKSTIPPVGTVFEQDEVLPQGVLHTLRAEAAFCGRKRIWSLRNRVASRLRHWLSPRL